MVRIRITVNTKLEQTERVVYNSGYKKADMFDFPAQLLPNIAEAPLSKNKKFLLICVTI